MTDTLRQRRPVSPVAIALFLLVYAAALVVILGPKDLLVAIPGSQSDLVQE